MHSTARALCDSIDFERWLIARSFRMLVPLCRLGLLVVHADAAGGRPAAVCQRHLGRQPSTICTCWPGMPARPSCISPLFLALAPRLMRHRARKRCLAICMALGAALFTWFGYISWVLSGDMSTYAIFLLTMVCVFSYPGRLRKALGIASTARCCC